MSKYLNGFTLQDITSMKEVFSPICIILKSNQKECNFCTHNYDSHRLSKILQNNIMKILGFNDHFYTARGIQN